MISLRFFLCLTRPVRPIGKRVRKTLKCVYVNVIMWNLYFQVKTAIFASIR